MGGKRRLKADAPRLLGRHDGRDGQRYRRAYAALAEEFGPFTSALLRFEAGRTAVAMVNLTLATEALATARRARDRGKGRRPSPREIERLARRQGVSDASYSAAVAHLRELVAHADQGQDLARALAAHYQANRSEP